MSFVDALYQRAEDLLIGKATGDLIDGQMIADHLTIFLVAIHRRPITSSCDLVTDVDDLADRNAHRAAIIGEVFGWQALMTQGRLLEGHELSARRAILFALIWASQKITTRGVQTALNSLTQNIMRWVVQKGNLKEDQSPNIISLRAQKGIVAIGPDDLAEAFAKIAS